MAGAARDRPRAARRHPTGRAGGRLPRGVPRRGRRQRFLGGETVDALLDRVAGALDRLLADPGWDTVLAVLHGGVNRAILSLALTGRRQLLGAFEQAPACINILDVDETGAFVVRAVNATPWDPAYLAGRTTTMEELWSQYRPGSARPGPQ
jgi:broad specificity phosphatase PhoE